jgi:hypothetical protein
MESSPPVSRGHIEDFPHPPSQPSIYGVPPPTPFHPSAFKPINPRRPRPVVNYVYQLTQPRPVVRVIAQTPSNGVFQPGAEVCYLCSGTISTDAHEEPSV